MRMRVMVSHGWSLIFPVDSALLVPLCPGILLPGGTSVQLLDYVHSPVLQHKVLFLLTSFLSLTCVTRSPSPTAQLATYWNLDRPVGAIDHGLLVLARARDLATNRSLLSGVVCTTYPSYFTAGAWIRCCFKRLFCVPTPAASCGSGTMLSRTGISAEIESAVGERGRMVTGPIPWGIR
jgi:hypothetical protein